MPYAEAADLMRGIHARGRDDWLLLLEHPHVYTLGVRARAEHVLVDPASVGAELVQVDRGGDVTYHGPGQLVGYPVRTVDAHPGASVRHVTEVEDLVIDALRKLGMPVAGRLDGYPGVWVGNRKICAIGVRVERRADGRKRTLHGFALNVDPDLSMFDHIVPCGILDKAVTSMVAEGLSVTMNDVVDAIAALAVERWGGAGSDRQDVAWRVAAADVAAFTRSHESSPVRLLGRLAAAGVDTTAARPLAERKPEWLRRPAVMGEAHRQIKRTMRSLDLVTVCEEAGCPNIFECWADGTATFMINGARCTRACGFCLVDTRRPQPVDRSEPARVAEAVERMGLEHAVVTTVARDDLVDGGAGAMAATIEAIRMRCPSTTIEVLISDCKGSPESLGVIFEVRPDVLNHNIETVARLQRAVRPSAGYARSLTVLARAARAGLTVKSGLMVGLGETDGEVVATLADLGGVGVSIATVGQYLRPTADHLPVARWVTPEVFEGYAVAGRALGLAHVESSPLTRSSYHARDAALAVAGAQAAKTPHGSTIERH